MYTRGEDLQKLQRRLGVPAEAGMEFEIQRFEYDVVEASMANGRAHDVTMFIHRRQDPRDIAVIKKPFFPRGAYRAPSGAAHPGESLEQGALRESLEETGLEVEITRYLARIEAVFTSGDKEPIEWTSHIFQASETGGIIAPIDTGEIEEARWASMDEVQGAIRGVLLASGWGLFRYRVALTDLTVERIREGLSGRPPAGARSEI